MTDILLKICEKKRKEVEYLKTKCSLTTLKKLLPYKENRGFKKLLEKSQKNKKNNIIAEIKKQSPSAGEIIKDYDPKKIAIKYEESGAGAISILTENNYFKGEIDHLPLIKKNISLPILRKDFIIDEYQIFESKVYQADAILLICSILSNSQIKEFVSIAIEIGLDCLIETHNIEEIERAIKINYPLLGINNRNLKNLSIDTNNTIRLIEQIPNNFTVIGESGIKSFEDINNYNNNGIYNFLIGETLLRSKNINNKFNKILNNDNSS